MPNPIINLDVSMRLGRIENRLCALEAKTSAGPVAGAGKVAFMANTGTVGARQTQVADLVRSWNPDAAFMAGGGWAGTGGSAGVETSYAAFNFLSVKHRLFPALGDTDVLNDPLGALTVERFKAVNGESRYYGVDLPALDMSVFVLNTSQISGDPAEPDGLEFGEAQYEWLVEGLKESTRKWRVVVTAAPYALAGVDADLPATDWKLESLGVHLVISSALAPAAHMRRGSSHHLVHLGGSGDDDGSGTLAGATAGTFLVWRDPGLAASPSAALLTVSKDRLWLDITDAADGNVIHSLCIQ